MDIAHPCGDIFPYAEKPECFASDQIVAFVIVPGRCHDEKKAVPVAHHETFAVKTFQQIKTALDVAEYMNELADTRLTYSYIGGSPELLDGIASLYSDLIEPKHIIPMHGAIGRTTTS